MTTGPEALSDARRREAAEVWGQIALAEHASVPSFARFLLELIALGAPPPLLDRTASAISDEIRHARLAFRMAGQLRGRPVGPSGLDVSNAVTSQPAIEDVCLSTLTEGCIQEGIAAAQARVAAQACSGDVREIWATIAVDEAAHAELAWSCVEWFLSQAPHVGPALCRRLEEFEATLQERVVVEDRADLLDYGILSRREETRVAREAFTESILPRALALIRSSEERRPSP